MSPDKTLKKARRWRRKAFVVFVVFVVLPLLGWLGSNLVLNSGWGRGKLAAKMGGMTGFQWTVGGAGWSPWSGVTLSELEAAFPNTKDLGIPAVLEVEEVTAKPHWGQLFRGQAKLKEVMVERPEGELSLEMLAAMTPAQTPVMPPVVKQKPAPQPRPDSVSEPSGDHPVAPKSDPPEDGKKNPVVAESKDPESAPDPGPATRVVVRNAKLRIYSEMAPELDIQLTGLQAEFSVAGPAASGWVELGEVKLGDRNLVEGLRVGLEWQNPVLILPETEFDCWGLPLRVQAQALSGRRMLTSVQVGMPRSALESRVVSGFPGARASAAQVEMVGRFQGDALRPATWQGNLVAAGRGLVVENAGKPLAFFEYGRVAVDFRNGVLHVPDGRLISESFSLLGNGSVNWDGRILGVLRVVADPSGNEALTRGAIGTYLSRWTSSWLEPLETPDRLYRDVHLEGPIGQARMDLGRSEDGIVVWQAWKQVASFLRGEQLEETMGVPHSPERDRLLLQK